MANANPRQLSDRTISRKRPPRIVLVAETDAATRATLRQALAGPDYLVFAVDNAADALCKVAELIPDLILLDVELAQPCGSSVYAELLSRPTTRTIPVVLLISDIRQTERTQPRYFLERPVSPDVLLALVRKAIRRSRLRSIASVH
jgi:two-component system phosphate regulon response regulator PhoB